MWSTKLLTWIAIVGVAIAVTAPAEAASMDGLVKRAEPMTVTYVNSCVPGGDGDPPVCDQEPYVHFGTGNFSCKDKQAPFNTSFCSTFGKIPTPAGEATWHKAATCKDKAKDGTPMGSLTAGKTVYHCFAGTGKAAVDCGGIEYVAGVVMRCHT